MKVAVLRILYFSLTTTLLMGCTSATREKNAFHVEPKNRVTFSFGSNLPEGASVQLHFEKLFAEDFFLINRCGDPCNTSKVISSVHGPITSGEDFTFEVHESGKYYFWIQKILNSGETGPVFIDKFTGDAVSFKALFSSGTVLNGTLILPPD